MIEISVKDEELKEWLQLLVMAKKMGLSIDQIRHFLNIHRKRTIDASESHIQP